MFRLLAVVLTSALLAACGGAATPLPSPPAGTLPPGSGATPPPDTVVTSPPILPMPPTTAEANPYAPKPGDDRLMRGNVYIDAAELLVLEIYPPMFVLVLRGSLPTPCNELRIAINPPDDQNRIMVDVYSVVDPNLVCIQVLQPFDANVSLSSFATGHYTVWVNGEKIGEFDT